MQIINRFKYPLTFTNGLVLLPSETAGERDEVTVTPNEVTPEQWGPWHRHPDTIARLKAHKLEIIMTPEEEDAVEEFEERAEAQARMQLRQMEAPTNSHQQAQQVHNAIQAAAQGIFAELGVSSIQEAKAAIAGTAGTTSVTDQELQELRDSKAALVNLQAKVKADADQAEKDAADKVKADEAQAKLDKAKAEKDKADAAKAAGK